MKKMKKTISIIITILMCLSIVTACGSNNNNNNDNNNSNNQPPPAQSSPPAPPSSTPTTSFSPGTTAPPTAEGVKYADTIEALFSSADLALLNPHNPSGNSPTATQAYKLYLDTLVDEDMSTFEILPNLAERWDVVDSTEFTFYLRDDVYFHSGEKLTADDVIFTVYASKTWGQGGASRDMWDAIETYTKIDENTVYFKLKTKDVEYLSKLAMSYCGIVSEKAVTENDVEGYFIGTGAYIVTDFSSMDHIYFERNEDYWGEKPITKYQNWRIFPEASTRTIMLQTGQADAILAPIPEGDIDMFMADPDHFEIIDQPPGANPQAILFNMTDPICGDYNFRLACVYALNREEIALIAQGPYGYIPETDGTMWGYYMAYRNKDIPYIEQDLAKAEEYLKQSSYKGEEVEILTAMFNSDFPKAAEVIQQQFKRVGISTKITITDNAGIQAATQPDVRAKNQIILWGQTLNQRVSSYMSCFYSTSVRNRQSFSDAELDELLDLDLVTEFGPEKEAHARRMQEIVSESLCTVNLFWQTTKQAAVKGFGGIRFAPVIHDYRYVYKIVD